MHLYHKQRVKHIREIRELNSDVSLIPIILTCSSVELTINFPSYPYKLPHNVILGELYC